MAPPPGVAPAATAPRPENQSFAKLVGYVGTNVGILVIRDGLKRSGLEASEPDAADIDRTTDATADAIARALGDAEIPWWGTLAAAWGSLYLSMRLGAKPLAKDDAAATEQSSSSSAPAPTTATGAAPVLGQGVPQRRPSPHVQLPEVPITQ